MSKLESFPNNFGESAKPVLIWDPISSELYNPDEVTYEIVQSTDRVTEALTEDQFPTPITLDPEAY